MSIVTLTTDWGTSGHYVAQLKGAILGLSRGVTIVDITHEIPQYSTLQAAFVLRHCYKNYPAGSIHIVGINSEPNPKYKLVVFEINKHYFIGINDGFFGILLDDDARPTEVIELEEVSGHTGFKALPIFAYTTQHLVNSGAMSLLGKSGELYEAKEVKANFTESSISTSIIHIDKFGNIVCNVSRDLFNRVGKGRAFEIILRNNNRKITQLDDYYYHEKRKLSELFALFNSGNLLEIGMYQADMAQLEGLELHTTIQILFNNNTLF